MTITVDFQEETLNWYSEPTLGNVLFTGNTFITLEAITSLTPKNLGRDGTFNGQPLPATDYWFVSKTNDYTPLQKGHFSLIR